jgi:para-nitrobenzyl esterase
VARRVLVALLLIATALVAGCDDEATPGYRHDTADKRSGVVVETASGSVVGSTKHGVSSWLGIPYAAPPVGDLRWRPPQPAAAWDEPRDATEYGPGCLQGEPTALTEALIKVERSAEDCLTLNVHRPSGDADGLPVMVWIHGGGFVYGSGSQPTYNSPELARRGVVLVSLNYRLGRLGFLAHPALQDGAGRVANFGLLDQVAALQWVDDNIEAFGGDRDNVTVFGESAGAISVNALMSSPAATGLFDRAISESGFGREASQDWEGALADGEQTLEPLVGQHPTADDLRALDSADVVALPSDILAGQVPLLDDVLPRSVSATFEAGDEAAVPYLVGTTDLELPEAAARMLRDPDVWRAELIGDRAADALAAYGSQADLDLHIISDVLFTEPARHLALEHAEHAPSYRYLFRVAPQTLLDQFGGAPHTSEVPFVFDDTARLGVDVPHADALADEVADMWVDFATDGEPDAWPLADTGELMSFTLDGAVTEQDPWTARLDLVEGGYTP